MFCNLQRNRYLIFLLLSFFQEQYCYGQIRCRDTLFEKFRNDLLTEQQVYGGMVVMDDETRESYYLLMATLQPEDLAKFTDDSIPAVRSQIFDGMFQKNADEKLLRQILAKHLNDTAKFTLSPTDIVINWSVKEYMQSVMNNQSDSKLQGTDFKERLAQIRRRRHVVIPGAHHGIIIKDSLLRGGSLISLQEGPEIISFILTFRKKTIKTGNELSEQTIRKIRRLRHGEGILIDNIIVEEPDKMKKYMNYIYLKIK